MAKVKSNAVTSGTWDAAGNVLTLNIVGAGTVVFDRTAASTKCRDEAERQGWYKRLINAAAISRDEETGKSATPAEKFDAVKALADHYATGTEAWHLRTTRTARELTMEEKKALMAKWAAEMGMELPLDNASEEPDDNTDGEAGEE